MTKILLAACSSLLVVIGTLPVGASDYTSTNFIVRDPVITVEGGRSTTSNFELYTSTGQTDIGETTTSAFIHRAGFLYFEAVTGTPTPAATHTPGGSGGGPGGGAPVFGGRAVFTGKAYPNSVVTILKDAQIAGVTTADNEASFSIALSGLSAGRYIFSLYSRDYDGRVSPPLAFALRIEANEATTVGDIVITPTITVDKVQVAKGERISIFGQMLPNANASITIKGSQGEFVRATTSDVQGKYALELDTSSLPFGEYRVFSRVFFEKLFSAPSVQVDFTVGTQTIVEPPLVCPPKGDLNGDCLVNLVDFSILIFWFYRPNFPSRVDLDNDGSVNLIDFSVMAYYWTG